MNMKCNRNQQRQWAIFCRNLYNLSKRFPGFLAQIAVCNDAIVVWIKEWMNLADLLAVHI